MDGPIPGKGGSTLEQTVMRSAQLIVARTDSEDGMLPAHLTVAYSDGSLQPVTTSYCLHT